MKEDPRVDSFNVPNSLNPT